VGSQQQVSRVAQVTETEVAVRAQEASDSTGRVAVVNMEVAVARRFPAADGAPPILLEQHPGIVGDPDAVLPSQLHMAAKTWATT
jgi:hypothetical protein